MPPSVTHVPGQGITHVPGLSVTYVPGLYKYSNRIGNEIMIDAKDIA